MTCQTWRMQPAPFAAAIERDGRALVEVGRTSLDAPVVACPGWVVGDVLGHLGRVHRSVSDILETRTLEPPTNPVPAAPKGPEVVPFFDEGVERLLAALDAVGTDTPVYTWGGEGTAAFYFRRMAHEIAIHRHDAQAARAAGTASAPAPDPIDGELAVDGIDELFDVVLAFALQRHPRPVPAASMHLHRTDGDGEWLVRGVDGTLLLTREHAKGDVAVRGPASDLLLFLWNRGRADTLELFGDEAVATAWAELAP